MSKQEKETIIVEKEEDNVEVDDDSSDEGQSWAEVSASASKQVQRIVQTPPNEPADTRGRQTAPVRGGRGGFRGRGRGAPAHAGQGGRTVETLQSVIDSQNKIIAGQNVKIQEQAQAMEKLRVNHAALQTKFFDVKQEKDNLEIEKETRLLQKQARLTQKAREVIQKAPDVKK